VHLRVLNLYKRSNWGGSTKWWNKDAAENIGKIVGKSLNIRKINSFHFILSLGESSNEYKLVYFGISQ